MKLWHSLQFRTYLIVKLCRADPEIQQLTTVEVIREVLKEMHGLDLVCV